MNFYGPDNRDEHTLAGRLIPLAEALYHAVLKAGGQTVSSPHYSVVLPTWVHNICDRLTKTIFHRLVAAAPGKDRFDARSYGQIVGILLRGANFWFKDFPAQLKRDGFDNLSPEKEAKLEKIAGVEQVFPVASEQFNQTVTNEDELLQAGGNYLEAKAGQMMAGALTVLQYLAQRPVAEQYEFLCGLPEGFAMFINQEGEFAGKPGRREMFLILLAYWPEIVEMQREQPLKTRRHLLEWLEEQEGRQLFEDPKAFYELCRDIDLDLAPPGHPSKPQPQ